MSKAFWQGQPKVMAYSTQGDGKVKGLGWPWHHLAKGRGGAGEGLGSILR